jgi:hypothetical protein
MTTNETLGPSGTVPDRYLEDILADEMSANAPTDETDANRDARRELNKKRNERCRRLRESLPIQNLAESLNQFVKFEVANFETSYHAILDRPAIAKFMAVPHYTYLVLKIPSPTGVLSLQGDLKVSFDCDTEAVELAATNQLPNAMTEIYAASKKLAPSELDIPEKSDKANKPQPTEEVQVKTIDLRTGDSSKTTTIGAGLDPK